MAKIIKKLSEAEVFEIIKESFRRKGDNPTKVIFTAGGLTSADYNFGCVIEMEEEDSYWSRKRPVTSAYYWIRRKNSPDTNEVAWFDGECFVIGKQVTSFDQIAWVSREPIAPAPAFDKEKKDVV